MSDLSELYQEVILDHNRRPRNFRVIDPATREQEGYNPLCGDRLRLYLTVADGRITDVAFQGSGCAISKASASLMTEAVKGRTVDEARALFDQFHQMITSPPGSPLVCWLIRSRRVNSLPIWDRKVPRSTASCSASAPEGLGKTSPPLTG